jgi:hypothetical protein
MDWVKKMVKTSGLEFSLIKKFGSDGYQFYWRTVDLLAQGNHFSKPLFDEAEFFEYTFVCVPVEKIKEIYLWLSQQKGEDGTPKMYFKEIGTKWSVLIPALETLNRDFARKNENLILEQRERWGDVMNQLPAAVVTDEERAVLVSGQAPVKKQRKKEARAGVPDPLPPVIQDFINCWNKIEGVIKCEIVTPKRFAEITEKLEDSFFEKNWKEAMRKAHRSDWLTSRKRKPGDSWKPSIDWFIRPDGTKTAPFVKIWEGGFDNEKMEREAD